MASTESELNQVIIKLSSDEVTTALAKYAHEKLGLPEPRSYSVSVQLRLQGGAYTVESAEVLLDPSPPGEAVIPDVSKPRK